MNPFLRLTSFLRSIAAKFLRPSSTAAVQTELSSV